MHEGEREFRDLLESWKDDPEFVAEGIALALSTAVGSALKSLGMTQKRLAEKIKVSASRVSQIMAGNLNLTLLTMCKVALGVGLRPSLSFLSATESETQGATTGFDAWMTWPSQGGTDMLSTDLLVPRQNLQPAKGECRVLLFNASPSEEGVA